MQRPVLLMQRPLARPRPVLRPPCPPLPSHPLRSHSVPRPEISAALPCALSETAPDATDAFTVLIPPAASAALVGPAAPAIFASEAMGFAISAGTSTTADASAVMCAAGAASHALLRRGCSTARGQGRRGRRGWRGTGCYRSVWMEAGGQARRAHNTTRTRRTRLAQRPPRPPRPLPSPGAPSMPRSRQLLIAATTASAPLPPRSPPIPRPPPPMLPHPLSCCTTPASPGTVGAAQTAGAKTAAVATSMMSTAIGSTSVRRCGSGTVRVQGWGCWRGGSRHRMRAQWVRRRRRARRAQHRTGTRQRTLQKQHSTPGGCSQDVQTSVALKTA